MVIGFLEGEMVVGVVVEVVVVVFERRGMP